MVATLAGLVASSSLPLAFAVELFESKVEGAMRYGRWLLATAEGAEDILESCVPGMGPCDYWIATVA
jgi:hypothetical protein